MPKLFTTALSERIGVSVQAWSTALDEWATKPRPADTPYLSGGFLALYNGAAAAGVVGFALDTVIALVPFLIRYPVTITSLNTRTTTGAAGSAVKMALWASSTTTGQPVSIPIVGSNTGQSTVTTNTTQTVAVSTTLQPGRYWYGAAVTTLAPAFTGISFTTSSLQAEFGRKVLNQNLVTGFSTPYPYANDIMALNLTGATLTDLAGVQGVPIIYAGTA